MTFHQIFMRQTGCARHDTYQVSYQYTKVSQCVTWPLEFVDAVYKNHSIEYFNKFLSLLSPDATYHHLSVWLVFK